MRQITLRTLLLVVTCCSFVNRIHGQEKINVDDIKFDRSMYIFYGKPQIEKCDAKGKKLTDDEYSDVTAEMYSAFTVHKKLNETTYVISFLPWSTNRGLKKKGTYANNILKSLKYNHRAPKSASSQSSSSSNDSGNRNADNKRTLSDLVDAVQTSSDETYFLISSQDLKDYAYVYDPIQKYEFSIGTISYLAKMRPMIHGIASRWTTDLGLGLAAGVRKNLSKNLSVSLLAGIAVTKISLDDSSTKGVVLSNIEKPAITPNFNLLFTYKIFSVGFGVGADWINIDSKESKSWIYNREAFYAVGFGINIFSPSTEGKTAVKDQ